MATLAFRANAALACLLAAGCGAAGPPSAAGPVVAATGRTAGGAQFRVTVAATVDPGAPGAPPIPAWCPRVDFRAPGRPPTHGAVGCREVRPHLPTGGFAMFCRTSDVFVLLLSSPATRSVSVETAAGPTVALTPYPGVVLHGRFWLAHYTGRTSPVVVASVEDATRLVQRYPPTACIGRTPTNGLLGR
jgi:hypothetical protein